MPQQGHGVYTWANGAKYDGEYKDNKKNGHGLHTWPDGSMYEGRLMLGDKTRWVCGHCDCRQEEHNGVVCRWGNLDLTETNAVG